MIRIADLYAGIGGIRLGFEQAFGKENIDCVFTSEIDKYAVITYTANFGNENIFGDISKIKASSIPDFDILLAGFPCQSFSSVGLQKGFYDERGQAVFEIERILKEKQPKTFILENVPNLLKLNGGNIFKLILFRLKSAGYKVMYKILCGKDFGVPQNRCRLYIVGCLDHDIEFEFPTGQHEKTCVGNILEKDVNGSHYFKTERWKRIEENWKKHHDGFRRYQVVDEHSEYTPTLIARYLGHPEKITVKDNNKYRQLTERECARLQGFPDSFIINKVSRNQIYKQLGNSVCVPVIKAIAKKMKDTFFKEVE
ncbi:MAG: DNA (cytosine-5-)-methyltransferase [Alphaproteobacteria bacterium]|nr:DNA (cytosine-5-)-methyltransferase [Alphaproteobacteria bacterium]